MNIVKEYIFSAIYYFLRNIVYCFQGLKVYPGARVRNVQFEENVKVYNGTFLYDSSIGRHTYIQRNCTILNASIGRFCSIAEGVKMGLGLHPISEFISTHPFCYGKNPVHWLSMSCSPPESHFFEENKRVIIGHDVCIGANTVILDGVKIGNGAIIGAGAVVTKDIPPYAVAAGVPCKVLFYRFDKLKQDELNQSQWWDNDYSTLEKNLPSFKYSEPE
ncbi:TPA: CatB-related O-acetyltransferase [Salmonella bongori]|nr:CatB-related O-acetyltransferase [Salmonella bongori]